MKQDNVDPYKEIHRFSEDLARAEKQATDIKSEIEALEKQIQNKRSVLDACVSSARSAKASIAKVACMIVTVNT